MKLFFKILFSIIGVAILLVIVAVLYVGISVYSDENQINSEIVESAKDTNTIINDHLYDTFANSNQTSTGFEFTEYEFNELLYSFTSSIDIPYIETKGVYSIFNSDGSISVRMPAKCMGFKTCAKANLKIEETNGDFKILINDIGLGKLGTDNFIVKTLVMKNLKLESLGTELAKQGIYVSTKIDNNNVEITMTKANAIKTIKSLAGEDTMYASLAEYLLGNNDLIDLYFNENNKLGVKINLDTLRYSTTPKYNLKDEEVLALQDLQVLITNGVCNKENSSALYDYLIRGYADISDEYKEIISPLDLSSVGISNNQNYTGLKTKSTLTMAQVITSFFKSNNADIIALLAQDHYDIVITEDDLNEIINSQAFVGSSICVLKDGSYKTFTLEGCEMKLTKDHLEFYLYLSINDNMFYVKATANTLETGSYKIVLDVDNVYCGSISVTDSTKKEILSYLKNVLEVDFIKVDANESTLTFSFESYLNGSLFVSAISNKLKNNEILLETEQIIIRFYK